MIRFTGRAVVYGMTLLLWQHAAVPVLASTGDWPQMGRDPSFTSFSGVHDAASVPRGKSWVVRAGDRVVGSPAVVGDRLWFGSDDGHMYCVNRTTGVRLWAFAVTGADQACDPEGNACEHGLCKCRKIRSSPAVDPRTLSVVFGSYDFAVYKLDRDGRQIWRTETGGAVYGPATLDKSGDVFIGSFDGNVYRFDGATGEARWEHAIGAHGDSGWALAAGAQPLVLGQSNEGGNCTRWPPPDCPSPSPSPGGGDCFVFALDAATGKRAWRARTGAPGGGGMVVEDESLGFSLFVAGSWANSVVAYDLRSGKERWRVDVGGQVESHPAYHAGVAYVSTEESKVLLALNASTGKELWRYGGAAEELNSSPTVSLDSVFVGANDRFLHAVDRRTGRLKFKVRTCANVFASAALADDGMVYVACNTETGPVFGKGGKGAVYGIDPAHPRNMSAFDDDDDDDDGDEQRKIKSRRM